MNCGDKEIFLELYDQGCCLRCSLRFLGDAHFDSDNDLEEILKNTGLISNEDDIESFASTKKSKFGSCCVCVGVLEDSQLKSAVYSNKLQHLDKYSNETCSVSLELPYAITIREFSMKLHVKEKFPSRDFEGNPSTPIKNIFTQCIEKLIKRKFKKEIRPISKLSICYTIGYDLDDDETHYLMKKKRITTTAYPRHSRRKIDTVLNELNLEQYSKFISIPPRIPLERAYIHNVKVIAQNSYVIGRYCKLSRLLPQKNLLDNDKRAMMISIESTIINAIHYVLKLFLKSVEVKFHASSYDETSVRVLGDGRAFSLTFIDPKFYVITVEQLRQIQDKVNKSNVVRVHGLREVEKNRIHPLIDADILKSKSYSVLCQIENPENVEECIKRINNYPKKFKVSQRLPMKIMYQDRDASPKIKVIHRLKARKIRDGGMFAVEVDFEAGLHVDEFIHGDLGRTNPSLADICHKPIDVIASDIMSLNVDVFE